MPTKYTLLKLIAIIFGLFTFIWMAFDFLSNKKVVNNNYTRANSLFLEKNYYESHKYYELALAENPKNIYYLEGKARSLFRMGSFSEAEKIFLQVIDIDNEFVAAFANLGILYDTLGNYEDAIKYYRLAVLKKSKITEGMSWMNRFLKNIHFKPSSIQERLIFLENSVNKNLDKNKLRNNQIDKKQPDFEM